MSQYMQTGADAKRLPWRLQLIHGHDAPAGSDDGAPVAAFPAALR